jgi:hypothetical protein
MVVLAGKSKISCRLATQGRVDFTVLKLKAV